MALINKTGITNGGTIQAEHITRAIDALSGGSSDSVSITGSLMGSASYALTASYALNGGGGAAATASFALSASNAYTASIALTASKILVSDNTSLTGPQPIMLATGTGATRLVATDTTDFSFNPIANVLTVAKISGASTSTSASVEISASSAKVAETASVAQRIGRVPAAADGAIYVNTGYGPGQIQLVINIDGTPYEFIGNEI